MAFDQLTTILSVGIITLLSFLVYVLYNNAKLNNENVSLRNKLTIKDNK